MGDRCFIVILFSLPLLMVCLDKIPLGSMSELRISIDNRSQICVGSVAELLEGLLPDKRVIVITDTTIDRLYADLVHRFDYITVGYGEVNKTLQTVQGVYTRLMELGADRSTFLLGIGGGIVTDITGYVAATYMRGVDFGFVPTTLLGQVDAAIGGKNGVNVAEYKNMVGTFAQPRFVLIDVSLLHSLSPRELRAGMAEVVKAAVVGDASLFEYMEANASPDIFVNRELMQQIVLRSVRVKVNIVERDEREHGLRRLLNLGHTLGHAIEKCTRELTHGEAVAVGMALMAQCSVRRGIMAESEARRIEELFRRFDLVLEPPLAMAKILREVKYDKKKYGDRIRVVMPEAIGRCRIEDLSFEELENLFS